MTNIKLEHSQKIVYSSAKRIIEHLKLNNSKLFIQIAPKRCSSKNPESYCTALRELFKVDPVLFNKIVGDVGKLIPESSRNPLGFSRSLFFESIYKLTNIRAVNNGFRL